MSKSLPLTKPRPRWAEAAWDSVVSESDEHAIDQIVTGGPILGGVTYEVQKQESVGANTGPFIALIRLEGDYGHNFLVEGVLRLFTEHDLHLCTEFEMFKVTVPIIFLGGFLAA